LSPYILANTGEHFRNTYFLHFQGSTESHMGKIRAGLEMKEKALEYLSLPLPPTYYLNFLIFCFLSEEGDKTSLKNIGKFILRWSLRPVSISFYLAITCGFFTLKKEAPASSESQVNVHIRRCQIPEGSIPKHFFCSQPVQSRPAVREVYPSM
jgi:hypothetical protein